MRAPDEAKEQVRDATDIVALVGEKVTLRRSGRSWKGLCPFHSEKTPSFTVNPERQVWHCFGCGKGGDAFAWLMELENVTFPEALQSLADRAGIELPKTDRGPADQARERLYQANALANDYFKASLRSTAGAAARAYLAGRGFEDEILDRFQVGWAPEGWEGLATTLGKLMPPAVLEEAGLTLRRGDGSQYDRFRNRIMFPVLAAAGKVAGFGARAIVAEDQPKYLNSPETAVYRKGSVLFGLPQARPAIRERKEALVAEGYLDVMRLHSSGFANAVSTSGTALTFDQARALARLEAEAVLVYDGDDAGVRAADRALEPLVSAGLSVRVLLIPGGEDPDSLIRAKGPEAFRALLAGAKDLPAFYAEAVLGVGETNPTTEARVRRFVEVLGRVEDPIRRRLLVRRGAEAFGLEEQVLLEALARRRAPKGDAGRTIARNGRRQAPRSTAAERAVAESPESPAAPAAPAPLDPVEAELAARVLTEDGALSEVAGLGGLSCFRNEEVRSVLRPWLSESRIPLPDELRRLMEESSAARGILAGHPVEKDQTLERSRRAARGLVQRLEERRIRARLETVNEKIRQAERSHDEDSLVRLVAERTDLASKLHSTHHPAAH
ncbi:MAG TPA: DNA primase [Candidatus Eisenbacteria bacterium]|nr:DNA primase [Candidatus Eisenbacteria bacterium]